MSLLTERQRVELNKCLACYIAVQGDHKHAQSTAQLLQVPAEVLNDDTEVHKSALLLEKKWTSIMRLQHKILDLESQLSQAKSELANVPILGISGESRPTGSGSGTHLVETWLPRAPARHTLSGHRQPVTACAFHPTFSSLATSCEDGSIKIWDWELGELERTIKAHTRNVLDVDYSTNQNQQAALLASCSADLTIKIWDPSAEYSNIRTFMGHDHTISSVKFTSSAQHLVSASRDKTIRVWEVRSGFCIRKIIGHSDWVRVIEPSIDGNYILSAGSDHSARISSFHTGEGRLALIGHEHVIETAVFAPQSCDKFICQLQGLDKPPSAHLQSTFKDPAHFSYVATGSRDKTIRIWSVQGGHCIAVFKGHDNWVRGLVFHPSGRYLLSVSDDKTIRCWDFTQGGKCVKVIQAHHHFVTSIAWIPPLTSVNKAENNDKQLIRCVLATTSVDLDVKVWM